VNHSASVDTSEPSSSCANFLPFTFAVLLRSSDISCVPSLNLKPNPRGGTTKKMNLSYKKFVEATQKKKSNRPPNSKPIGLCRMLFLVLQKDEKKGLPGSNAV
jgi:hypothetical protein